ncbi:MAG: CAP domain-containing protein [Pseudomonadota bacterium]|nr:CAP domain-containing protein [Pseudomonadota bacterium]
MEVKRLAAALIGAGLLLAGCGATEPVRVIERRPSDVPALRGDALLRQAMLEGHNAARAAVGEPPLAWDAGLAADAAAYARTLARTGEFRHADQPIDMRREGENLFTGTRDAYSYREMVDLWVAEKADFVNRPTPDFSRGGRWENVAHYTQIVWRGTTRIGCALASNATDDYLVCRYSPPGNVVGQAAF